MYKQIRMDEMDAEYGYCGECKYTPKGDSMRCKVIGSDYPFCEWCTQGEREDGERIAPMYVDDDDMFMYPESWYEYIPDDDEEEDEEE